MTDSAVLPMFPLGTVLLPGEDLPLRVFEPRYRQLVQDCLESELGPVFGVVLIARGHEVGGGDERYDVGTAARIRTHTRLGPQQSALTCVGLSRIRVDEWLPDAPYPRARVTSWPDEPRAVDLGPAIARFEELVRAAALMGADLPVVDDETDLLALARAVPMGPADRYAVLSATDEAARLTLVVDAIESAIDQVRWRLGDV